MKHNWEYKRLGEVCDFIGGGTPSKSNEEFYKGNIPWATVRDMLTFKLSKTELCITEDAVMNSATNILPKGMIVISTHVGLGKICELMQDTAINQDLKGISFTDNSIIKYFFTYWYHSISNFIISKSRGATVKGVTLDFMKKLSIPVPPMDVQEQIVAELDKINEVIEDCRELLRNLDTLAQSLFYDYFGDPISNPKGWERKPIKSISPSVGSSLEPHEFNGKYWLLNLDQVESNTGRVTNIEYFPLAEIGNSTVIFDEGNVLYSKLRPYLNKVVIPNGRGYCTSELIPLRPKSEYITLEYIAYALRLPEFVKFISAKTGGAKMPRVKMPHFWNFQLPVPPLELQNKFAERIEQIEEQKQAVEKTISELQTLLNSRMDYWFNDI